MESRIILSLVHIWDDQLMITIQLSKSSQYGVKEILNHRKVSVSYQTWICSLLKEINKQTLYAVVFSSFFFFFSLLQKSLETSLQIKWKTFTAKVGFGLSLGKSTQIGSQDFYHENIRIVIWIFEAAKHSPFVAALAECSLCTSSWLLFLSADFWSSFFEWTIPHYQPRLWTLTASATASVTEALLEYSSLLYWCLNVSHRIQWYRFRSGMKLFLVRWRLNAHHLLLDICLG